MFRIKITTFDLISIKKVEVVLKKFNLNSIAIPKKKKRFVVLKSPHVNSKAKEHFGLTQYRRLSFSPKIDVIRSLILTLPYTVSLKIEYAGNGAVW